MGVRGSESESNSGSGASLGGESESTVRREKGHFGTVDYGGTYVPW